MWWTHMSIQEIHVPKMKTYMDLVGNYSRDSSARVDLLSDYSRDSFKD